MSKKTIAIDFDGVINSYISGFGPIKDPPIDDAINAIEKLSKQYQIVIFTARPKEQHISIREWLIKWSATLSIELPFDDIKITNEKPIAIAYIDDRGIRFTNWKDILNYFI